MKILKRFFDAILLSTLFLTGFNFAQSSQAMYYLNYPQSVASLGMGEQGVALLSNDDALIYNPANLVFTDHASLSYFAQPFYVFVDVGRIISLHSMFEIKNVGYFGVSYQNWSLGEFDYTTEESPDVIDKFNAYERNFSIAYARNFSKEFSAGLQVRYSYLNYGPGKASDLLYSAGLHYRPESFCNKLNLGFSLTNFGPAVKYEAESPIDASYLNRTFYDPPPSNLNLAVNYLAVDNSFFSIPLNLGISKIFDEREDNGEGQSSFKTLLSDWNDFPRDVTVHSGLAFQWKPLDLGGNVAFFQEFYLGNFTGGPKTDFNDFYTHGFNVGLSFSDIKLTAGYAGRWFNQHISSYLPWSYPWETFQFTISIDENYFLKKERNPFKGSPLEKIIISAGVGQSMRVGRYSEYNILDGYGYKYSNQNKNSLRYFIEAAFYINKNNALVTNFSYSSVPWDINVVTSDNKNFNFVSSKYEDVSINSSYRIHPIKSFNLFFVEGGIGIQRTNPVIGTNPKYYYQTYVTSAIGANINVYNNIILSPRINYIVLLDKQLDNQKVMVGFNQFDFDLSFGYAF